MYRAASVSFLVLAAAACGDNVESTPDAAGQVDAGVDSAPVIDGAIDAAPDGAVDAAPDAAPVTECSTTLTAGQAGMFVELCALENPARHVRIAGVGVPAVHASAQLAFGFEAAPASTTVALEPDQFRVLLYGGGTPAPAPVIQASWGAQDQILEGDASVINTAATVCFDLHPGSATSAPAFVLWVDGVNGADCEARSTLTIASAYGVRAAWRDAVGALDDAAKIFYRQAATATGTPTITLSETAVLGADAIAAAVTCSGAWTASTDWQAMCAPAAGAVRHVRISDISSTASNSYWYAVLGEEPAPTGNPANTVDAAKLIVTGGQSNSGASWTYFRFDGSSTTQFTYTNTAGGLYVAAPTTVCFDLGSSATGTLRILFWATGSNGADCADFTTLTPAAALYDSTTDVATGAMWDKPLAADKASFVKTNNATSTLGTVTTFSEAAAL